MNLLFLNNLKYSSLSTYFHPYLLILVTFQQSTTTNVCLCILNAIEIMTFFCSRILRSINKVFSFITSPQPIEPPIFYFPFVMRILTHVQGSTSLHLDLMCPSLIVVRKENLKFRSCPVMSMQASFSDGKILFQDVNSSNQRGIQSGMFSDRPDLWKKAKKSIRKINPNQYLLIEQEKK